MSQTPRRQKGGYFTARPDAPAPVIARVSYRAHFSDVDAMAVVWHGHFARLFEQANEELCRRCGMTYADFHRHRVAAPIVQLHVDYFSPVRLGEQIEIAGKLIWSEAARMNIEYEIRKENGELAAAGYTVQMFVGEDGKPLLTGPELYDNCRKRWLTGEFKNEK